MSTCDFGGLREVWAVDFEFGSGPGEKPIPLCLVAEEWHSKRRISLWQDELERLAEAPYGCGADSLVVAYYASAEMGCHLALDWPMPVNVLDLYAEFRNAANGFSPPCGWGLLGALAWYGLPGIEAADKDSMRKLALRCGSYTEQEIAALLEYCGSDVAALVRLLERMGPSIDLPRALMRGRYMRAAAHIEFTGVPIDVAMLNALKGQWSTIQLELIREIDRAFGVYDGSSFRAARFAEFLEREGIPWPRLPSGALDLRDDTFRDMARAYPVLAPLQELRSTLSQMRLADLAVGADGRNRVLLSAFRARTGRNQPSNSKFIFGPAVWLRSLIKPAPGRALAYIDWSQQEFGVAAALSRDAKMLEAYLSGDPYLSFAKQAGAVPADATKSSHPQIREQFKACALAVQYGMEAKSLAQQINRPEAAARALLRLHHETYRDFWKWADGAVNFAMLFGRLWTVLGWTIHTTADANPRSLRNFPMQANGAEMLRYACCLVTEAGIAVCAPVHDALLVEDSIEELDDTVERTQTLMAQASETVLGGLQLRTDVKRIVYPERYEDPRGARMWEVVTALLERDSGVRAMDTLAIQQGELDAHARDDICAPVRPRPISLSHNEVETGHE